MTQSLLDDKNLVDIGCGKISVAQKFDEIELHPNTAAALEVVLKWPQMSNGSRQSFFKNQMEKLHETFHVFVFTPINNAPKALAGPGFMGGTLHLPSLGSKARPKHAKR